MFFVQVFNILIKTTSLESKVVIGLSVIIFIQTNIIYNINYIFMIPSSSYFSEYTRSANGVWVILVCDFLFIMFFF